MGSRTCIHTPSGSLKSFQLLEEWTYWKKQYANMGSLARRTTRKRSKVLGHKSRVSRATCEMLVSPSRNLVRKELYEAQIAFHNLPVKKHQLQRKLKEYTKGDINMLGLRKLYHTGIVRNEAGTVLAKSTTLSSVSSSITLPIQIRHTLT